MYRKMVDYLKKALIYGHTSRTSSWIYYQFTIFEGKSLDMPPASPNTSTQHWERINENGIRRRRGVSLSLYRENRNAAFFMPSCYAVGAKRALLYAALRAHFCRGQGFIPLSPKMPFYCVTFQYLHQWESGVRWLYDSCRVPVFSNCRDYYILPNVLIVLLFHYIFVHFPNHQYPHVFWTHNHQYFLYP